MTQQTKQSVDKPSNQDSSMPHQSAAIRTCVTRRPSWMAIALMQLVILLRDGSGSMSGRKAREATIASGDLVLQLADPVNQNAFHCGVIDFSSTANTTHPVTQATELAHKIKPIRTGGSTNIRHALDMALQAITDQHGVEQDRWTSPVVVLYSDGDHNEGGDPVPVADQVKQTGAVVITVAYGDDANIETLRAIATSSQHCYARSATGEELRKFMTTVGKTLTMTMATGHDASAMLGKL